MKKILLLISFVILSLATYALNPFAYALSSELSADQSTLTVKYKLNATATSVQIEIYNGQTKVKTVDGTTTVGDAEINTVNISTEDLPGGANLTWKVVVNGESVKDPTLHGTTYSIYHPSSVDIDNNPENETFGLILANEGVQNVKDISGYISSGFGAGILAFNPAFEHQKNGTKPGYNGGITFPTNRPGQTGTDASKRAYVPRRVRISEDGRIFVTSLNPNGGPYLWELNPKNLDEWTPVFDGEKINSTTQEITDADGNFIAGPNTGFDVRGKGSELKLLMYSTALTGWPNSYNESAFKCYEYDLGVETTWSKIPSRRIFDSKYAIVYNGGQVEYDAKGRVWFCQYRSGTGQPSLMYFDGVEEVDCDMGYYNKQNGAIRFNKDYSKVIIAGTSKNETGKATVYAVSEENGKPKLTESLLVSFE